MSEPIKIQCTVFQPDKISSNGQVISKECFDKAIKEYLEHNANKCLYISNRTIFGEFSHDINDICGKIDDIKEVDGEYVAEAEIIPNLPMGKICSEVIASLSDNIEVKPDGFYNPVTNNFTITGFAVDLKKKLK